MGKSDQLVSVKQVKSMIESSQQRVASKYLYQSLNNATVSASGTLIPLDLPPQGVSNGEREGDSMLYKKITTRMVFANDGGVSGVQDIDNIRVVVVQAITSSALTLSNPSAPTTGIFDNGVAAGIDNSSMINLYAKDKLLHVLLDKSYPVNYFSQPTWNFEFDINPKLKKIDFTPATTTPLSGKVYFIFFSMTVNANVAVLTRSTYIDL
jgi:hypothetical protein